MSRDCCVALPHGAMGLSVVCDCGILTILDFLRFCKTSNTFIVFYDLILVLKAMNHTRSKNPQIKKLLENVESF